MLEYLLKIQLTLEFIWWNILKEMLQFCNISEGNDCEAMLQEQFLHVL